MSNEREWLASLKPGDEVIVVHWRADEAPGTVYRRTPSGRIIVSCGGTSTREFNADGWERGGGGFARARLVAPTQERKDAVEHRALADRLGRWNWDDMSLQTLRQIAALLDDAR